LQIQRRVCFTLDMIDDSATIHRGRPISFIANAGSTHCNHIIHFRQHKTRTHHHTRSTMKLLLATTTTTTALLVSSAGAFVARPLPVGGGHRSMTALEAASRKPFISGNWKLNPQTKEEATKLAADIAAAVTKDSPAEVALFVPYVFIEAAQKATGGKVQVGAEVSAMQESTTTG
jgi:Triosephosphate isomerase